jgi:probable HAF family extracellular repeat protein
MVWDRGKMTDLGTLPGTTSGGGGAYVINDRGQIVGYSTISTGNPHAVLWSPHKHSVRSVAPGHGY